MEEEFTAFVHLLNPANHIYGQIDKHPINDYFPTSHWRPDENMKDEYVFAVRPGTPAGRYEVEIGVYRTPSFERLPVLDEAGKPVADRVGLGPGGVAPAREPPGDLMIPQRLDQGLAGELKLLGYDLDPPSLPPGGYLRYQLLWQKT